MKKCNVVTNSLQKKNCNDNDVASNALFPNFIYLIYESYASQYLTLKLLTLLHEIKEYIFIIFCILF